MSLPRLLPKISQTRHHHFFPKSTLFQHHFKNYDPSPSLKSTARFSTKSSTPPLTTTLQNDFHNDNQTGFRGWGMHTRAYHTPLNFQILSFSISDITFLLENRNWKWFSSVNFFRKTSSWWSKLRLKFKKSKKLQFIELSKYKSFI